MLVWPLNGKAPSTTRSSMRSHQRRWEILSMKTLYAKVGRKEARASIAESHAESNIETDVKNVVASRASEYNVPRKGELPQVKMEAQKKKSPLPPCLFTGYLPCPHGTEEDTRQEEPRKKEVVQCQIDHKFLGDLGFSCQTFDRS